MTSDNIRATKGLKLIEQSTMNPLLKMKYLMAWREPYQSKANLNWLINEIKEMEKS